MLFFFDLVTFSWSQGPGQPLSSRVPFGGGPLDLSSRQTSGSTRVEWSSSSVILVSDHPCESTIKLLNDP